MPPSCEATSSSPGSSLARSASGTVPTRRASATPQTRPKISRMSGSSGVAFLDARTGVGQEGGGLLDGGDAGSVDRGVEAGVAQDGDAQPATPSCDSRRASRADRRAGSRGRAGRSGRARKHQGAIADRAGHRPGAARRGRRRRAAIAGPGRSWASARPGRTRRRGCARDRPRRCRYAAGRSTPPRPPPRRRTIRRW